MHYRQDKDLGFLNIQTVARANSFSSSVVGASYESYSPHCYRGFGPMPPDCPVQVLQLVASCQLTTLFASLAQLHLAKSGFFHHFIQIKIHRRHGNLKKLKVCGAQLAPTFFSGMDWIIIGRLSKNRRISSSVDVSTSFSEFWFCPSTFDERKPLHSPS